jgi:hypothetical protein
MELEDKAMQLSESYAYKYADFMLKALHESELEYETMLRLLRGLTTDAFGELLLYIDRTKK